ncbi:MAG: DVU0772 family protein [Nitrospirota bacterium]
MMFSEMLSLEQIKKEQFVIDHIRWDLEPKDLMEPRCKAGDEGPTFREPIKGYIFYIDAADKKPQLFLMRHTAAEYAETLAKIDEVPEELLLEAMEENKERACFRMYPISKKIEAWLKKELGIAS